MSFYKEVLAEHERMGLVQVPNALERLCTSIGCHVFNLQNIKSKRFYYGGSLENFRLSIVFMAPSGYSKSQHFNFFLNEKTGFLNRTGIPTSVRGTFSPEAWMGTIQNEKIQPGIIEQYKHGIVGADEFMRLGNMMNGTGVNNDEVTLMKALDTDNMSKDLSYGAIKADAIGFTLWAGMRPCLLGLKSGLARRFSFQIFCPTIEDSAKFRQASRTGKMNTRISLETKDKLAGELRKTAEIIDSVESLDYSAVYDWIDKNTFSPHFEESLYKRMALGWSVINDYLPEIKIDDTLHKLLLDEITSRSVIRDSPEFEAVRRILRSAGRVKHSTLKRFLESNYQLHKIQVDALIRAMESKMEIITVEGDWYTLPETITE